MEKLWTVFFGLISFFLAPLIIWFLILKKISDSRRSPAEITIGDN